MFLIIGLGNPEKKYKLNRHNIGFLAIDKIADNFGIKLTFQNYNSNFGISRKYKVILVKPLTYMNNSGEAVKFFLKKYKLLPTDIIIIYDDLDLELGKIRIREKGSSGGHKGLISIIQHLNTEEFPRIRVGIGRPQNQETIDFVLSNFKKKELSIIEKTLEQVVEATKIIIENGISKAMNKFN